MRRRMTPQPTRRLLPAGGRRRHSCPRKKSDLRVQTYKNYLIALKTSFEQCFTIKSVFFPLLSESPPSLGIKSLTSTCARLFLPLHNSLRSRLNVNCNLHA